MNKRWKICLWLLVILLVASFFKTVKINEVKALWFSSKAAQTTAKNEEEFIQAVYKGMLSGEKEITINYYGKDYKEIHNEFLDRILPKVFDIDKKETSDDFDYMSYNLDEVGINTRSDLLNFVTIIITPKWKESKEETQYVNQKVKEIIESLSLDNDADYVKIQKIHNYVVNHFEYDETLENYTVYKALKEGKMICQGYMLLTYKLLTEAGIETKCIDGIGTTEYGTQTHGWNLVKLGKYWYNLDTTWDDPVLIGKDEFEMPEKLSICYDYFLKGNIAFLKDHKRNSEFETLAFKEKYPVSSEDYAEGVKESNKKEINKTSKTVMVKVVKKEEETRAISLDVTNNLELSAVIFGTLIMTILIAKKAAKK